MTSKFVKVKCEKCKNEQMVFVKAASKVKCLVCGDILAEPTGGKARFNVKVIGTSEKEEEKPAKHEKEAKEEE
ncbi:MAG: 30S ribosomal protein S27e [Candidatus Aenigmarchaeota archaeon]|nr:30S ribosomal protein S27e [Candidatus Aenigmarchaeota archaeon]